MEYGATVVTQPDSLWHLKDLVAIPSLVRKHRSIETANISRACEGKTRGVRLWAHVWFIRTPGMSGDAWRDVSTEDHA